MPENSISILLANLDDLPSLEAVEKSAARKFQEFLNIEDTGITLPPKILMQAQTEKLLWIITHGTEKIGFLCARLVDKQPHIEEFSIGFDHQGNGYGRKFLCFFTDWAKNSGYEYISLTTDKIIPWNAPYYSKLDFQEIGQSDCASELQAVLARDKAKNPKPENRIAMILRL